MLELTETILMHDVPTAVEQLMQLKAAGVRISIDDFGTGYSSFAYLRKFPIDILKIDKAFVDAIADTWESAAIVHTLVQLGKVLGLEMVAEGIETDDQWMRLRSEGVEKGQGFKFARPLNAASVDLLLADLVHGPCRIGHDGSVRTRGSVEAVARARGHSARRGELHPHGPAPPRHRRGMLDDGCRLRCARSAHCDPGRSGGIHDRRPRPRRWSGGATTAFLMHPQEPTDVTFAASDRGPTCDPVPVDIGPGQRQPARQQVLFVPESIRLPLSHRGGATERWRRTHVVRTGRLPCPIVRRSPVRVTLIRRHSVTPVLPSGIPLIVADQSILLSRYLHSREWPEQKEVDTWHRQHCW